MNPNHFPYAAKPTLFTRLLRKLSGKKAVPAKVPQPAQLYCGSKSIVEVTEELLRQVGK